MRSMLIVLLVCLVALVGCKTVSSFFANPTVTTPEGLTIVGPSPAENALDKIIGLVSPFAGIVPWGGFGIAIAAAIQQFLKLRRTQKPIAAVVQAVETLRTNPETKQTWSDAVDLAIAKTGLRKETLTAFANEIKARAGIPIQ